MKQLLKTRKAKLLFATAILFLMALIGGGLFFQYVRTSHSPFAVNFRRFARTVVSSPHFPRRPNTHAGLVVLGERLYINNQPSARTRHQMFQDSKRVIETPFFLRLVDYTHGFMVDLPLGTQFDFSLSPDFITAYADSFTAVISREWAVEMDVRDYIHQYFNRFLLNPRHRTENGITLLEDVQLDNFQRISVAAQDWPLRFNAYTFLYFKTGSRFFYRIMVKYPEHDMSIPALLTQIEQSFTYFMPSGRAVYSVDWYPVLPDFWTPETRVLFDSIADPDSFMWGIFTEDVRRRGINELIPALEQEIGVPFEIILAYTHLHRPFQTAFMDRAYSEGRIVQLTLQFTTDNNEDLYARSPVLAFLRGDDAYVRAFARAAADWGRPFLFRLNNEMNTDWVSYGGVNNLADPEVFVYKWRKVWQIFKEEGVNNAIWIWNPQDISAPPNGWNSFAAYFPGNNYVHMLGITGYNTGTYYAEAHNERWREFYEIYDAIVRKYDGIFDDFVWIITEFASSSIGGCKVSWIERMFLDMHRFPRIRAAVWFSYTDWDPAFPEGYVAARPYWLDETVYTLDAFRRGRLRELGRDY